LKLSDRFQEATNNESHTRNQILQAQLRLAHVKEGKEDIWKICAECMDVFKLTNSYVRYLLLCFISLNSSELNPYFAELKDSGTLLERG
jgi:hypothetical protein